VKYPVCTENNLAVNPFANASNHNLLDFNYKPTLKTYVAEAPTAIVLLVISHDVEIFIFGATSKNCSVGIVLENTGND
jgi:hypothetical protein